MTFPLPPKTPFVGRSQELDLLMSVIGSKSRPAAIVITGPPGVGKTALAINFAHLVKDRFPDGQLYLHLRIAGGNRPPAEALRALISQLGIADPLPESLEERSDMFRSLLAKRRVLLVLDSAGKEAQVQRFIPRGGQSMAIVTSRSTPEIEDADVFHMSLDILTAEASVELLGRITGSDRVAAEPQAATELADLLGHSPLALCVAGERIADEHVTFAEYIRHLMESRDQFGSLQASVDYTYKRLGPLAATVLRRLSLVDEGEQIPLDLLPFLIDHEDQEVILRAVDELSELRLLSKENDLILVHNVVREYARSQAEAEDSRDDVTAAQDRARRFFLLQRGHRPQPEPLIARDYWTLRDQLSYQHYADAIAEFIRHRQTRPPLTIGLKAPWGAGKTSLMRMIQNNLDPQDGQRPCRIRLDDTSRRKFRRHRLFRRHQATRPADPSDEVTNLEILRQADLPEPSDVGLSCGDENPDGKLRAELAKGAPIAASEWRPTVWFNPWMFQSGEQIWAGLAHEIISQVTARLPTGDRERFWLKLNLARVDPNAVRGRLYRLLAERVLPFAIIWLVAIVVALVTLTVGQLLPLIHSAARVISATALGGGTLALVVGGYTQARSFLRRTATGPLASLVRQPDIVGGTRRLMAEETKAGFDQIASNPGYSSRLGFLNLVQTDMKRVLDLVATERRPLVVLVDDLDRCSPGAVAQVIEAINLFLAGEFPNCIFVLAMEPGAVAAHVEVAYKDLTAAMREGRLPGDWATLGWRFLEKIVQLPLSLPAPRADRDIPEYLRSLIGLPPRSAEDAVRAPREPSGPEAAGRTTTASNPPSSKSAQAPGSPTTPRLDEREISAIERAIRSRRPTPDTLRELALEAQMEVLRQPAPLRAATFAAADRIFADLYSDIDAHTALISTLPALASCNPREIKRFVNLFRFYSFIVERQRLLGFDAPSQEQTAKLAALAIRWPHLVSMLGSADVDPPLAMLERAARNHDLDPWIKTVRQVFPARGNEDTPPDWSEDLRLFLQDGTEIGAIAARLL